MARAPRESVTCPFTIVFDSAESQPFSFDGMVADADKNNAPMYVPMRCMSLGRHPNSLGDYSILGLIGQVAIERKSREDCISTVLGWQTGNESEREIEGRRDRFRCELANLHRLRERPRSNACVIVEATLEDCLRHMPGCDGDDIMERDGELLHPVRGKKTVGENSKIFLRSIESWTQIPRLGEPDLRVDWKWCETRRDAEIRAFRWLEKFWEHLSRDEQIDVIERVASCQWRAA